MVLNPRCIMFAPKKRRRPNLWLFLIYPSTGKAASLVIWISAPSLMVIVGLARAIRVMVIGLSVTRLTVQIP